MRNLEFYDSVPASNKFRSSHTYNVINWICRKIEDVLCETLSFRIQILSDNVVNTHSYKVEIDMEGNSSMRNIEV